MIPKVLIVDDEPTIRSVLFLFLKRLGCSPTAVANGLEAESIIAELQPDLVLLDIMMPMKDGYETCRKLRQQGFTRPIILMSSGPTTAMLRRAKECGANDYFEKPFSMDSLERFIASISQPQL